MRPALPSDTARMIGDVSDCLEEYAKGIPFTADTEWKDVMKDYMAIIYPEDDPRIESITAGLLEAYLEWSARTEKKAFDKPVDQNETHALMTRPQTTQRTADWYTEFQSRLTASEFSRVFGSPRERGTLIMQKAGKLDIPGRGQKLVCYREAMAPFDWGICFEPVVKQIIELDWEAMIHECGRFVHQTDPRFAASPDGLILRSKKFPEMGGHLVEIKCPKSRKIGLKIPSEYVYQMQLQMEVTGVRACEYVEAKFEFVDESQPLTQAWYGKIAVVGLFKEESGTWVPVRYEYGTINDLTWKPDLGLNEQTLQLNTWACDAFHHERVLRDRPWFETHLPAVEGFWADVALAKSGDFTLPPSSRKKKEVACEIVDSEPEDGKPEDGKPEDGKPEDGKPEDGKPEDGKPEDGNIKTILIY